LKVVLRHAGWVASLLLLAASAGISHGMLVGRIPSKGDTVDAGAPYPLGEISRRPALAFGFRNLLADVVWLEAVQVSGTRMLTPAHYDRMVVLLDAISNFDPYFRIPYLLGGLILGESIPHSPAAVRVLERGWKYFPDDWRFPFYIGYTRYFCLGDAAGGGRGMMEASRLQGSPAYLPRLAARMLAEGREPETALSFLQTMVAQESDPARKEILLRRALELAVERDLQALERAARAYRDANGSWPKRPADLVAGGFIGAVPAHPAGGRYGLKPDGEAFSTTGEARMKIFKGKS
jgi:hypothetical protein